MTVGVASRVSPEAALRSPGIPLQCWSEAEAEAEAEAASALWPRCWTDPAVDVAIEVLTALLSSPRHPAVAAAAARRLPDPDV